MSFPEVGGLEHFWAKATGRAVPAGPLAQLDKVMLDALGLGLEQTFAWLRAEHPDFAGFRGWIEATAGPPDAARLARYHATLEGRAPPPETAARLALIEAMAPVLKAADLALWDEQGYVIVRSALSADETAALAAVVWAAVGADPGDPGSWYGPRSNGIMIQQFQHPAQASVRRSTRVHKAFAQLWGHADLWSTTDRLSFNPPERPGHPFAGPHLHWDCSLARPIPFGTQGIIYLEDTAADQGALQLVPGFHRRIGAWLDGLGNADPRTVDLGGKAKCIGAEAGDLIIWRQDLPHGASANRAARPRLAQYLNMYPADYAEQADWL